MADWYYAKAGKPDAPSGTARELAERLEEVRAPALGVPIDESFDQPRTGDPVHFDLLAGNPFHTQNCSGSF